MSAFTFPTVCKDTPADIVERLAARAVASDYRNVDGMHTWTFPSPERMAAYAAREYALHPERPLCRDGYQLQPGDAWAGADHPHALWMATVAGWPEAAAVALDVYDRLTAHRLMSRIPTLRYEEEPGEDVDVSAYLSGEDACFLTMALTDTAISGGRSAVTLRHNVFASCFVDIRQQVTRGLIATAIVHLLETAGVQVTVEADMRASYCGAQADMRCVLKHYGEPADIPRLAYWLAHPSVLRRLVFAATSAYFTNHQNVPREDPPDVIRVTNALVGGQEVDAVELACKTLEAAGFALQ